MYIHCPTYDITIYVSIYNRFSHISEKFQENLGRLTEQGLQNLWFSVTTEP